MLRCFSHRDSPSLFQPNVQLQRVWFQLFQEVSRKDPQVVRRFYVLNFQATVCQAHKK